MHAPTRDPIGANPPLGGSFRPFAPWSPSFGLLGSLQGTICVCKYNGNEFVFYFFRVVLTMRAKKKSSQCSNKKYLSHYGFGTLGLDLQLGAFTCCSPFSYLPKPPSLGLECDLGGWLCTVMLIHPTHVASMCSSSYCSSSASSSCSSSCPPLRQAPSLSCFGIFFRGILCLDSVRWAPCGAWAASRGRHTAVDQPGNQYLWMPDDLLRTADPAVLSSGCLYLQERYQTTAM